MGTELERRAAPSIEESFRVAKGFAMSGYFADAKSAEQAFVKVMAGAEMGLSPFQAMTGIHIIEGKPVVGAGLLAAMIDQNPEYDYSTTWKPSEEKAESCTVTIFKNGEARGASTFSLADAKAAGLDKPTRNGKQSNYVSFARNMLFARAMSNAVRWYAPGVTGQSTYTDAGEIEADALPPHIQALNDQAIDVTPPVVPYADPNDSFEDVPFVPATAAPAASDTAESPSLPGPVAADEPADAPGANVGGLIETVNQAQTLVNSLSTGEQLATMKRMLGLDGKTTRRLMADALFDQFAGWDTQDVLAQVAGWGA
jgi:hypothetical protein